MKPAFDELLGLEEQAQQLETDIGKTRDFVRQCSRRVVDAKAALATIDSNLAFTDKSLAALRAAPVVLMSEFERIAHMQAENQELRANRVQEIQRLEKTAREHLANLPSLEAQLKATLDQIENFSKVIPFRR